MKTLLVINEQHSLMPEQETLLKEKFGTWESVLVPASGWTRDYMEGQARIWADRHLNIVFASPIPTLLALVSYYAGYGKGGIDAGQGFIGLGMHVFILHNDKREKKELPNGKIINAVSSTGWQLVPVSRP